MASTNISPTKASYSTARLLLPTAFAGLVAYQSLTVMPLLVGALIDYRGFSPAGAGMVGSIEIVAMALTAICMAPFVNRVPRHYLAVAATVGLAFMQFASVITVLPALFYLERFVAGMCAGALVGVLAATLPLARNPERVVALIFLIDGLCAVGLYLVLPVLFIRFELAGAYALLGLISMCAAPVFLKFPPTGPPVEPLTPALRQNVPRLVGYGFLISIASTALWAFTERLAVKMGFSTVDTGQIFALGIGAGLAGATLAALVGQRFGNFWPIVITASLMLLCGLSLPQLTVPALFVGLFCLMRLVQYIHDPFMVGVVVRLDAQGRLITAEAAISLLGAALGPFIAGQMVHWAGLASLGPVFFILSALAYVLFWKLLRDDQIAG